MPISHDAFDFSALPPEINSARMYSGAGSAPLYSAAADEVSAAIAALFAAHGQEYQAIAAQAEAFHDQFVHLQSSGHYGLIV
jgi:predicted ATPase